MDEKYYIYPFNFWPGFIEKTDANHIGFFETLFSKTKIQNFELTHDINKSNVLLEAGLPNEHIHNFKQWKYKINFIGEPCYPKYENYDIVLTSVNNVKNVVDLPLCVLYIHCNDFFNLLLNKKKIKDIPEKFCSFIVSNPKCHVRNKIFKRLCEYKKVDSMGQHFNNVGHNIQYPYWSQDFFNILGSYKFIICGENTKMETYSTEKIVNPYLSGTIPIYWGSENIKNIFNPETMLFLENDSDEAMDKLMEQIKELDNNNEKYIEFINRPTFTQANINFWENNYSMSSLAKKVNEII